MDRSSIEKLQQLTSAQIARFTELDRLKATCDHRNENGRTKLKPVSGSRYFCKICRETINLAPIQMDQLKNSIDIILDALQQVKVMKDDISKPTLQDLGNVSLLLMSLPDLYRSLSTSDYNKGKRYDNFNAPPQAMQAMFGGMFSPGFGGMQRAGGKKNRW